MQHRSLNPLDHDLNRYLAELAACRSTAELHRHALYKQLKAQIDRVLLYIDQGEYSKNEDAAGETIRATAWNIERGIELQGLLTVLGEHPVIRESDLFILTELDYGMARSGNRRVAREIAQGLGLNFVFVPSYLNLEKGSGLENEVEGDNAQGLHGNALLSRFPLREPFSVSLPNGKDKMRGKEKRLGSQAAIGATIDHPAGKFRAVSVHLDAHSSQKHRMRQMRLILDRLETLEPDLPALIGGDWNTSTYNSRNAFFSIMGYARRVLMGVRHVIKAHYPYPDRWFERHLFRELERRGFRYRDLNEPGGCTLHYDVDDLAANGRMADWIPNWCFWFIEWALSKNGGKCSFKLDWFAGRRLRASKRFLPRIIRDVHQPSMPLSDHDPIVLDFHLEGSNDLGGEAQRR